MQDSWDVIVAGGGPAGLSASVMLGRSRRRVLVVDAGSPRNRFAAHMHGVLGHEGTPPRDLLERGRAEAAEYGVEFVDGTIEHVERSDVGLQVTTEDGLALSTRALIVATGSDDHLPDVPGLRERWGSTVLHCPYCHGWEVRDQHLGVLTTSPLNAHQAELVRQLSDRVTVFTAGMGPVSPETEQRLRSREIRLESSPVVEILGEGTDISRVRLEDGSEVSVQAIFTAGTPRPHDGFLRSLDLARTETPFGSFLAVDAMGKTSDDRIWAIGNVVNPGANVPVSSGAGALTGAAVNGALVAQDFDAAEQHERAQSAGSPADFWETRYADSDRVWSGNVNRVLADIARHLAPGRALDLGCGEGADAIWLAQRGWQATGIDISPTAVRRAAAAAADAGLGSDRARFIVSELPTLPALEAESYDLVTASFLHSPVEFEREQTLRAALPLIARGGHLLITSHAAPPPWADVPHHHAPHFLSPQGEVAQLRLDPVEWDVLTAETRAREVERPGGDVATLDDVVVLIRRR